MRGVMESLALKFALVRDWVEECTGNRIAEVFIVGGGAQNDLLSQWTANATALPVTAGPVEATAVGNIIVQAVSLGLLGSVEDGRQVVRNSLTLRHFDPQDVGPWADARRRVQVLWSPKSG